MEFTFMLSLIRIFLVYMMQMEIETIMMIENEILKKKLHIFSDITLLQKP